MVDVYDQVEVEKGMEEARRMLSRELPQMLGYFTFFYAAIGAGIPLRAEVPKAVLWSSVKASLLFGWLAAAAILLVGTWIMKAYLLSKARYTDFAPAASQALAASFRIFGVVGLPLAFWDIFRIVLPALGQPGADLVQSWWLWLVLIGAVAGWFSGRSLGGLVGLLAIWLSGRQILSRG